jgi:hypothetical protein
MVRSGSQHEWFDDRDIPGYPRRWILLSITVAVLTLLGTLKTIGTVLKKLRDGPQKASSASNAALADVIGLRTVLESVQRTLREVQGANQQITDEAGNVNSYWRPLADSLSDPRMCLVLAEFNKLLQNLDKQNRILDKARRAMRMRSAPAKIAIFRRKVEKFRSNIQLSLQAVTLYVRLWWAG